MNEQERYETIDIPFYHKRIAPILPPRVLDFHAHAWRYDQWLTSKGETEQAVSPKADSASLGVFSTAKYVAIDVEYTMEQLVADGQRMFPDRDYQAVCFGHPTPAVVNSLTNTYITENTNTTNLFPLIVAGGGIIPITELREQVVRGGYFGYKVFLNWVGNDYSNIKVEDMLTPEEMELANDLELVVMLHVPRSKRLAELEIQQGVREYAKKYPKASIVLAHCGRCYDPADMKVAIGSVCDLENVYMDTAMVMDPVVMGMALRTLGPGRLLYATDFPVAVMRGKRVNIMDHWVDVVLEGYSKSDFRVDSDGIHATFMAWEIVTAIEQAAEMIGITEDQLKKVFYDNGRDLLGKVMNGRLLQQKVTHRVQL